MRLVPPARIARLLRRAGPGRRRLLSARPRDRVVGHRRGIPRPSLRHRGRSGSRSAQTDDRVQNAWARPNLLVGDPSVVLRGAIEIALDVAPEAELLGQIGSAIEVFAKALRFRQVVVAEPDLDLELRVFLAERTHPLFDLPAAIPVAGALFEIAQQRLDDAGKDLRALLFHLLARHAAHLTALAYNDAP